MKPGKLAALEVKVGVFVFLLLVLLAMVIFLLGRKSNLFDREVPLRTAFRSASGLRVGAQVRLAGVHIGQVANIHFAEEARDDRIVVELRVREEVLKRITTESKARIDSMGLLGDKIIDISVGVSGKPIKANGMLPGQAPPEYLQLLDKARDILGDVRTVTRRLSQVITLYGDPELHANIAGTLRGVRKIVEAVQSGKGLVSALIFDRGLAGSVRRLMRRAGSAADRFGEAGVALAQAFAKVGNLIKRVERARGSNLHALLFGKDQVTKILGTANKAAQGLLSIIDRVKRGKGLLRVLLEGGGGEEIVDNLRRATGSLRKVLGRIEAGRGSIGALIADPTLYEDLKTLVGNLQRNRVLRALIRFAIRREEKQAPPVRETSEKSGSGAPPTR